MKQTRSIACYGSFNGRGIKIGHLDTGLSSGLPQIRKQLRGFRTFAHYGFEENDAPACDSNGHGTHIMSAMLAIAPEAEVYSGVVIEGGNTVFRLAQGFKWLLDKKVHIIVTPLSIPGNVCILEWVVHTLRKHNILVIAPIGNEGAGRFSAPGVYENVLSVGAAVEKGGVADFSGSQLTAAGACKKPDVLAPGVDISCSEPNGEIVQRSGTSMACAIVTGVAALLAQASSKNGTIDINLVERALMESVDPISPKSQSRCRTGIINPIRGLEYIQRYIAGNTSEYSYSRAFTPQPWRDPRLLKKLENVLDRSHRECMLLFCAYSPKLQEQELSMQQCIEACALSAKAAPLKQRLIPEFQLALVYAPVILIRTFIEREDIIQVSAADIERMPPEWRVS